MKLLKLMMLLCLLVIPGRSYAGCDDVYRGALVNYLRDKTQYATYTGLLESLTKQSRDAASSGSSFNLSAVVEGVPMGGGLSSSGTKEFADFLEQKSSTVISTSLVNDIEKVTGNTNLARNYNACREIEARGLKLELVNRNLETTQVTVNIPAPPFVAKVTSVDYDRKIVRCRGNVPKKEPIVVVGTLSVTCIRKGEGAAADIVVNTDAGALPFQLPGNAVTVADVCKAPSQLTTTFYSFGEAAVNVHKIPHDPGGGYYSKRAVEQIDDAATAMKAAGFSVDLYGSPMIGNIKGRITAAPTGTENAAYNVRTDIANQIVSFATFVRSRVTASCELGRAAAKIPKKRG